MVSHLSLETNKLWFYLASGKWWLIVYSAQDGYFAMTDELKNFK